MLLSLCRRLVVPRQTHIALTAVRAYAAEHQGKPGQQQHQQKHEKGGKHQHSQPHHDKKDAAAVETEKKKDAPVVSTEKPSLSSLVAGKHVFLAEGERKQIFAEGLAGDAAKEFEATGRPGFLIRSDTVTIASELHQFEESKQRNTKGYILTGHPGTGKSLMLNSLVYHFRRRGWLVLFIPNVVQFTDGNYDWAPDPSRPGYYKQMDPAAMTLQRAAFGNERLLRELPASELGDLSWLANPPRGFFPDESTEDVDLSMDAEEDTFAPAEEEDAPRRPQRGPPGQQQQQQQQASSETVEERATSQVVEEPIVVADVAPEKVRTVYDVVCSAAHRRYAAPYAFDALCKLLATQTHMPVVFAMDAVNKLYDNSEYADARLRRIPAERMSMCETLGQVMASGAANGYVLGAVSARLPMQRAMPLRQLQRDGYTAVNVRGYSKAEAKTVLDMYHGAGLFEHRVMGDQLEKLWMMTNGSGRAVLHHALCL